jgi:hypothetical protein
MSRRRSTYIPSPAVVQRRFAWVAALALSVPMLAMIPVVLL